ncbi:MAG TPA: magnesium transporter [Longimicrobiaceae bacterium]
MAKLLEEIRELIRTGTPEELHALLLPFHPSDLADLLAELDEEERRAVLIALAPEPALAAEALAEMEWDEHPEEALALLEPEQIATLVSALSDDDAADIIGELDPEDQIRVLAALPSLHSGDIRDLLRYHEETAGGLMTTELVAIDVELDAREALEEVRRQAQEIGEFYNIYVVDGERRLKGTLPLQALVTAPVGARIADLVEPAIVAVPPEMDQEEVGRIISRYNLVAVPVVDSEGKLLGRITFDDVIDVLEAETTEDILRFGGVSDEEEVRGGWQDAVRSRLPWLLLNLVTAAASATVVVYYAATIERLTLLAALMPVIAGMGGNTGTQALAVTIRRLALSRESPGRRWAVVLKELAVGLINGLAIGVIAALVTALLAIAFGETLLLALVVLLAMWMNLVVAGFAGAFVPIVLERRGVDPAVASSIFVTTFTDMVGFFLLLGLASWMLL